jgi:hypothetical protein
MIALVPVLARTRGMSGAVRALAVTAPILLKRVLGNEPGTRPSTSGVYLNRLVFDQDEPAV